MEWRLRPISPSRSAHENFFWPVLYIETDFGD